MRVGKRIDVASFEYTRYKLGFALPSGTRHNDIGRVNELHGKMKWTRMINAREFKGLYRKN